MGETAAAVRETLRDVILGMEGPIAQRYTFARYVLGEDHLSAAAIAGRFQAEPMDREEYDIIAEGWDSRA